MSAIWLGLFVILAAMNWVVAWRGQVEKEYVVKPAALAALLLFAATGQEPSFWLIAALVLCLLGDVYMMLPGKYFIPGLVAFLLGHVAYVLDFDVSVAQRLPWFLAMGVLTLPVSIPIFRSIKEKGMKAAVVLYMAVICFMAASALASGGVVAILGALLFVVSDSILAWDMFVRKLPRAHFWVMVSYHIGQLGLVLALSGFLNR